MSIWTDIRPVNGSQRTGFEKLCCQLAAYEDVPEDSVFIAKGDPDAGVECYWKLPNGDEWGWQAKFFLETPGNSQWSQITDSIERALERHPQLTRYYICIPLDRQNPRTPDRTDFMQKWDSNVRTWKEESKKKNIDVEFIYWGEFEIMERLSREENKGRHLFWFNEELFSTSWYENQIAEAIVNVGPRYSPEINVNLPINFSFECLGRTRGFNGKRLSLYREIKKYRFLIESKKIKTVADSEFNELNAKLDIIQSILKINESPKNQIKFDLICKSADESIKLIQKFIDILSKQPEVNNHIHEQESNDEDVKQTENNYRAFIRTIRKIKSFAKDDCSKLSNYPSLLIYGEAGTGKTHLLCDIAKKRVDKGMPTILLLGNHFTPEEPWSQMIRHLGLSCSRDEFLGALESAAQLTGSRALIFIDALNEGSGINLWPQYLAGMLNVLSRYPWIGIAISVRDSYLKVVIPDQIRENLVYLKHDGFASEEYQATEKFFEYYGINSPRMPLLNPEFTNPLFLKILCESLKNRGLSEIQPETHGISSIFNSFINSINEKLSHPNYLGFDPLSHPVNEAVKKIAKRMADEQSKWLLRVKAKNIVDNILGDINYENSLFRHLISEGILSEDILWKTDDNYEHLIRFTYERFTDYMIMEFTIKEHLNIDNPWESFEENRPLGQFFKDENSIYMNSGFIEALFILIPEQTGHELGEIIAHFWNIQAMRNSFLKSLFWRNLDSFSDETSKCIDEVIRYEDSLNQFLGCALTISLNIKHPHNAKRLHKWLNEFELAERDEFWSIFLYHQYSYEGSLNRLIDWALNYNNQIDMDEDVLYLYGIVLGWFLTTSHRYVRDKATKALVNLFTNHISVLIQIISEFLNVNDPYVLERLFAAAYGCVMRSNQSEEIDKLAKCTYKWVFDKEKVFPHILLRDYAREIIEIALMKESLSDIDLNKIRPPYKSEFPSEIPVKSELKKNCICENCTENEKLACKWICESVMGYGDFSRYIIGTNFGHLDWSSNPLNNTTISERFEKFVNSLTDKQKSCWENYMSSANDLNRYNELKRRQESNYLILKQLEKNPELFSKWLKELGIEPESGKYNEHEIIEEKSSSKKSKESETTEIYDVIIEELKNRKSEAKISFIKTLRGNKRKIFEKQIFPYLDDKLEIDISFDLSIAERWIFNKVFELGWNAKQFGSFDRNLSFDARYGRASKKPERISKKYQWIAFHEFLAKVSDNFEFVGGGWAENYESKYHGPWQVHLRDIDPSCLLKKTATEIWKSNTNRWWFPVKYENWEKEIDYEWIKLTDDLPDINQLLEVTNPEDGSKWLTLESSFTWEQPHPSDEERREAPRRHIYYLLKSYIVKKTDIGELFEWACKQTYRNLEMPYPQAFYNTFLGEFFWSAAFYHENTDEWTSDTNKLPCKILRSTMSYIQEDSGYDCSIDDSFSIILPVKEIFDKMELNWEKEGYFNDEKGVLIGFNPSTDVEGPSSFLIRKDNFFKFLNDNDYEILWLITGEKFILGSRPPEQRLEIMGLYKTDEKTIDGRLVTNFRDWNGKDE